MTTPGRNDPCPCGSGRKYKRCCGTIDIVGGENGSGNGGDRSGVPRRWVADVLPVPVAIDDESARRPVVVLVTSADGFLLHQEILGRLGGDPEVVADALRKGVRRAVQTVGWFPELVVVRDAEVAGALRPALLRDGFDVEVDASPPRLEELARGLIEALGGYPTWPPVGRSETWRGWELPKELTAELFGAAARYYEAAPWRSMSNPQAPRAALPSGRQWTACVLGAGHEQFGLVLYSDRDDLLDLLDREEPAEAFDGLRGRMLSLTYEPVADLPPRARTELALSGWKLAGPAAYPDLMTANSPGGGVSSEDARDLIALLDAIPAFVDAYADALEDEELSGIPCDPIEWTDARSGVTLRYGAQATGGRGEPLQAEPPLSLPEDIQQHLREIMDELEDEIPPDATQDEVAALVNERLQVRMAAYNARAQAELGGLSPAQVRILLRRDWSDDEGAIRLRRDLSVPELSGSELLKLVSALLALVDEQDGVGRTQAGNLQIAVVGELIERTGLAERWRAEAEIFESRRTREQDVWPIHEARLLADLGGLLRSRKTRFALTRRGHQLLDPARAGELFAVLFETCFRRFNIFYDGFEEWPELQHQIAFTLLQLGRLRDGWYRAEDLLEDVVLPFALDRAPEMGRFLDLPWLLDRHVLERLVRFGLMERRRMDEERERQYRRTRLYDRFLSFEL